MIRNNDQNKRLHALLTKLKIDKETKVDLVDQFTQGRETSTSKMSVMECQGMINHLSNFQQGTKDKSDKQRKKILSICHEMQWKTGEGKVDRKHLNEYLLKYGYLHKPLNDYTSIELPKLVTQFENLLKSYYAKL